MTECSVCVCVCVCVYVCIYVFYVCIYIPQTPDPTNTGFNELFDLTNTGFNKLSILRFYKLFVTFYDPMFLK